jgi:dethiobiotin synthetase
MQKRIFITGTDTDVGKTFFTAALIMALQNENQSVMAFKPVAAGCEVVDGGLKNQDALTIIEALNDDIPYQEINPVALSKPIAPHISAVEDGIALSVNTIKSACNLSKYSQSNLLVEGAGGWLVPLNENETFADYVVAESLDVILVVGLKLGCINHALLSQQSILNSGLNLIGWVANHIDPKMLNQQQNIETLSKSLKCPLIAQIPHLDGDNLAAKASNYVRICAL